MHRLFHPRSCLLDFAHGPGQRRGILCAPYCNGSDLRRIIRDAIAPSAAACRFALQRIVYGTQMGRQPPRFANRCGARIVFRRCEFP